MATVAMEEILMTTGIDNDIELPKKSGHRATCLDESACAFVRGRPFVNRRVDVYDSKWRMSGSGAVAGI